MAFSYEENPSALKEHFQECKENKEIIYIRIRLLGH